MTVQEKREGYMASLDFMIRAAEAFCRKHPDDCENDRAWVVKARQARRLIEQIEGEINSAGNAALFIRADRLVREATEMLINSNRQEEP
jgi:hypothetical protein